MAVALVNDTLETPIEEVVEKQRKQPVCYRTSVIFNELSIL
jgi:hypothetical protein